MGGEEEALSVGRAHVGAAEGLPGGDGEKKVKKKGWQPKRGDWRAGADMEVCLHHAGVGRACSHACLNHFFLNPSRKPRVCQRDVLDTV